MENLKIEELEKELNINYKPNWEKVEIFQERLKKEEILDFIRENIREDEEGLYHNYIKFEIYLENRKIPFKFEFKESKIEENGGDKKEEIENELDGISYLIDEKYEEYEEFEELREY